MTRSTGPYRTLAVLLVVLVWTAGVPLTVAATTGDSEKTVERGVEPRRAVQDGPANNTTTPVHHENPAEANKEGNMSAVEAQLAQTLSRRLANSAVRIEKGQYKRAQGVLGDEYSETLERYIEVKGSTGSGSTERFRKAKENQQEFASTVSEYRQTYEKYQRAKQRGNEERARELARKLDRLAERANRTGTSLNDSYTDIGNQTSGNFSGASDAVTDVKRNITEQQQEVTQSEFTQTELTVDTSDERVSFDDPVELSGQLTTANGTAIAEQRIALQIGNRTLEATTDEDGEFSVPYRPVLLPANASEATVQYVPNNSSVYLSSNDTVDVTVQQTEVSIRTTDTPRSAAYGDRITVAGTVSSDDVGVPSAPVVVLVDGVRLGTTTTDSDGSYSFTARLPANVSAGQQKVAVRLDMRDRAVSASPTRTPVRIERTPTKLNISANRIENRTVLVSGTLRTADGRRLRNRSVELRANGTTMATVETGPNGTYRTQLTLPPRFEGETVALRASYASRQTSLERAHALTAIRLGGTPESEYSLARLRALLEEGSLWAWGGLLALVLGLGGVGAGYRRFRDDEADASDGAAGGTVNTEKSEPTRNTERASETLLTTARARLEDGDRGGAIEAAYVAVRSRFVDEFDAPHRGTHWEIFNACRDALGSEQRRTFRQLTRRYERTAFGAEEASETRAQRAVESASLLLEERTASDGGTELSPEDSGERFGPGSPEDET